MWFDVVMNHTDGPLTTGQVAAIFGVTTSTVKRWADQGELPFFRTLGQHYRFRVEDIEKAKAERTKTTGSVA